MCPSIESSFKHPPRQARHLQEVEHLQPPLLPLLLMELQVQHRLLPLLLVGASTACSWQAVVFLIVNHAICKCSDSTLNALEHALSVGSSSML